MRKSRGMDDRDRFRRRRKIIWVLQWLLLLAVVAVLIFGIAAGIRWWGAKEKQSNQMGESVTEVRGEEDAKETTENHTEEGSRTTETTEVAGESEGSEEEKLLAQTERMAAMYDYDRAIQTLQNYEGYGNSSALKRAVASYEEAKAKTVAYPDMDKITHIFFHSLIADTSKAFDGGSTSAGYNQVMTTISEFNQIIQSMYEKGYVMVDIHDIAKIEVAEDGSEKMVYQSIYLPEGKIPFVLSQDDVSYYEYMTGDGFANRIVVDENGELTCEMDLEDGTTVRGDFDMVPLIEAFVREHPDFSYRGAKGMLCLTGYNGVLGYRTDTEYENNPTYAEDVETAKQVAAVLKEKGWYFASHSWGHIHMQERSFDAVKTDTDKWESRVEPILGETDVLVYPFGEDIGDWHPYQGEKFEYLESVGFRYFCNVDSAKYWMQLGSNYLRQGRRNVDGQRMWQDLQNPEKAKLSDLFDVQAVFDSARPTPVQ